MCGGNSGHYNEGMTVFLCSKCGTAITPELVELAAVPDVSDTPYVLQDDQDNPQPAQSRGPLVCNEEGFVISAGTPGTILVNPEDAFDLQPLPNWENSTGCCGPTGNEGLNQACPCGAPVATLAADCFGPYELHLDPVRTFTFSP